LKRRTSSSKTVHGVVIEAGLLHRAIVVLHRAGAQIDRGVEEFLDQRAERVGPRQPWDLIAELEAIEDLLYVCEKPSRYASKSALSCCWLARARKSRSLNFEVL
jgi:hypothetical protein